MPKSFKKKQEIQRRNGYTVKIEVIYLNYKVIQYKHKSFKKFMYKISVTLSQPDKDITKEEN